MDSTKVALVHGKPDELAGETNAINETSSQQEQLAAFYQLFKSLHRGGTYAYYWTDAHGRRTDWRRCDGSLRPKDAWLRGDNLYFGVHPTSAIPNTNAAGEKCNPEFVRSRKSIIPVINAIYAEIDAKDYVEKEEWLPFYVLPDTSGMTKSVDVDRALKKAQKDARDAAAKLDMPKYKARAREHMINAKLKASAIWDSGGGYQGIWLLDEPFDINDESVELYKHLQEQWVIFLGGDEGAKDLARVLRVPGSRNRKPKYAPDFPLVKFLWMDTSIRHSISEFVSILPPMDAPAKSARHERYIPDGVNFVPGDASTLLNVPRHPAVDEVNKSESIRDLLIGAGYTRSGKDRLNRPDSNDSDSVWLHDDNSATIFSSQDPLYVDGKFNVRPAQVLLVYKYNYDINAMMAELTGAPWPPAMFSQANINTLRLWNRTTRFSDIAPSLLRTRGNGSKVYTTDTNDTKVFDALCDLWEEGKSFVTKPVGKKLLGKKAGCSANSAKAALERLATFAVSVTADAQGFGYVIALNSHGLTGIDPCIRLEGTTEEGVNSGQPIATNDCYLDDNEYSPRKTHDVFQSGTSRYIRKMIKYAQPGDEWYRPLAGSVAPDDDTQNGSVGHDPAAYEAVVKVIEGELPKAMAALDGLSGLEYEEQLKTVLCYKDALDASLEKASWPRIEAIIPPVPPREEKVKAKKTAEQKQWDKERRGLGETSLRVLDALNRCGDMTAKEIAEETSKSIHSVRDALSRMNRLMPDLVHSERDGATGPYVWTLEPEAFDEAEALVKGMKTYKMALGREEQRLEQAINWTMHRQQQAEHADEFKKAERRIERLKAERIDVVKGLYELSDEEALEYASYVGHSDFEAQLEISETKKLEQYDLDVFMANLDKNAATVVDSLTGLTRAEAASKLRVAKWDEIEIRAILGKAFGVLATNGGVGVPPEEMDAEYLENGWQSKYMQVVELEDETFMAQRGGAWVHVSAAGMPVQSGVQSWA